MPHKLTIQFLSEGHRMVHGEISRASLMTSRFSTAHCRQRKSTQLIMQAFTVSTTSGRFGSGVLLHGTTSSWVNLSRSAMDGLNNFTVEFWAKSSDTSKSGTPIHGSSATGNNEFLIFNYG